MSEFDEDVFFKNIDQFSVDQGGYDQFVDVMTGAFYDDHLDGIDDTSLTAYQYILDTIGFAPVDEEKLEEKDPNVFNAYIGARDELFCSCLSMFDAKHVLNGSSPKGQDYHDAIREIRTAEWAINKSEKHSVDYGTAIKECSDAYDKYERARIDRRVDINVELGYYALNSVNTTNYAKFDAIHGYVDGLMNSKKMS